MLTHGYSSFDHGSNRAGNHLPRGVDLNGSEIYPYLDVIEKWKCYSASTASRTCDVINGHIKTRSSKGTAFGQCTGSRSARNWRKSTG